MIRITIVLSFVITLLSACSPEEPLINSFVDEWRVLVTDNDGVTSVKMPNGGSKLEACNISLIEAWIKQGSLNN